MCQPGRIVGRVGSLGTDDGGVPLDSVGSAGRHRLTRRSIRSGCLPARPVPWRSFAAGSLCRRVTAGPIRDRCFPAGAVPWHRFSRRAVPVRGLVARPTSHRMQDVLRRPWFGGVPVSLGRCIPLRQRADRGTELAGVAALQPWAGPSGRTRPGRSRGPVPAVCGGPWTGRGPTRPTDGAGWLKGALSPLSGTREHAIAPDHDADDQQQQGERSQRDRPVDQRQFTGDGADDQQADSRHHHRDDYAEPDHPGTPVTAPHLLRSPLR
jgi:hypothetical protein